MTIAPHHNFDIRLASPGDGAKIAELWAAVEPDTVWAKLGPRLSGMHWERYCHGEHEIAVTAWRDGALAGVSLGTDRPGERGARVYVDRPRVLAGALAREILTRPGVLRVLARRLVSDVARLVRRRPAGPITGADRFFHDGTAYMANFFVAPDARGQQLGTVLLDRFAEEMARRGSRWCVVHTTADNVASRVAQERAGFECVRRQGDHLYFRRRLAP